MQIKTNPTAFISYAWEDDALKKWVKSIAIRLRQDGIDVKLDEWELLPGDKIPYFMEKSVKDNNYVLIICTQTYKRKSDNRIGGVGYEGDIMTSEVLNKSNDRKFIPILTRGNKHDSLPTWLQGKYFIDFSSEDKLNQNYQDLLTTLLQNREKAPEIGTKTYLSKIDEGKSLYVQKKTDTDLEIKIKGIIIDEITQPKNDGTPGCALYKIPFALNKKPNNEWISFFMDSWRHPPTFTTMHRPSIASVQSNKIILDGTTIEEVDSYHKDTLKLAVQEANRNYIIYYKRKQQEEEIEKLEKEEHRRKIEEVSKKIKFD